MKRALKMVGLTIFWLFKLPTIRFYGGLKKSPYAFQVHINFQIFPHPKDLSLVCQSSQNFVFPANFSILFPSILSLKNLGPVSRKFRELLGPEKLFCVCLIYIQDQSFNNFDNDTMKLSVDEATLTGL